MIVVFVVGVLIGFGAGMVAGAALVRAYVHVWIDDEIEDCHTSRADRRGKCDDTPDDKEPQ